MIAIINQAWIIRPNKSMNDLIVERMRFGLSVCMIAVFIWASIDYSRFIKFWMIRALPFAAGWFGVFFCDDSRPGVATPKAEDQVIAQSPDHRSKTILWESARAAAGQSPGKLDGWIPGFKERSAAAERHKEAFPCLIQNVAHLNCEDPQIH